MTKSMTAFVREQGQEMFGQFSWEIRSVNHRYLDVSFRLPERFRELESTLREIASKHLNRGKVDCSLRYQAGAESLEGLSLNEENLKQLVNAHQRLKEAFNEPVVLDFDDILRWPGLMQTAEEDKAETTKYISTIFEKAVNGLNHARQREGKQLANLLKQRLNEIEEQIQKAQTALPQILEMQREKLKLRFEEAKIELNPERLEQEMVFLAQKVDISEELDRLRVHVIETRRVLETDKSGGRRLDFLMQEFNREANTLGSKSISEITTAVSMELKVLIEQMREQVQNIE